jgi:ribosomal protein L16 Arg81 hydroxylase
MCDYCDRYPTDTRDERGLPICELCQVKAEHGQTAADEVLAVKAELQDSLACPVSIDEAVSEWFARFLTESRPARQWNENQPNVNGGIPHGSN